MYIVGFDLKQNKTTNNCKTTANASNASTLASIVIRKEKDLRQVDKRNLISNSTVINYIGVLP